MRLSDPERSTLAEIGKRLGRTALQQVACVAKPDTILAWYRRLIARKFDGFQLRTSPGRPRIASDLESLIVRFARENSGWGYDRIVGALANLGHSVSDQTVGSILRRYGIQPAPKRSQNTTWKDFIASHMAVLAGTDFFTVEVLTWRGLAKGAAGFAAARRTLDSEHCSAMGNGKTDGAAGIKNRDSRWWVPECFHETSANTKFGKSSKTYPFLSIR
jgi:hypothetical protein